MYPSRSSLTPTRLLFAGLAVLIMVGSAFAATEKVVYSFLAAPDGSGPGIALVADSTVAITSPPEVEARCSAWCREALSSSCSLCMAVV
jgi:hypothetical protein